jgi:hypothetical protein
MILTAKSPTTSALTIPCPTCFQFSTPKGAHVGGVEYDAGTLTSSDGKDAGHFTLMSVGMTPFGGQSSPGELSLTANLVLGTDQLVGQGLEEPPLNGGVLAITGGTGKYANARGQITYKDNSDGSTSLTVHVTH